jgi:alditol oxidase
MKAGYSVSAITDFAGDDVDMLWVKSRAQRSSANDQADRIVRRESRHQETARDTGNDPVHCTPQLGEPGPWHERLPISCLSSLRAAAPKSKASI